MRPHGHASVSARYPRAHGICDRCGQRWNHDRLQWQFDWQGPRLQNLRILVCPECVDKFQEQLRTILLPPDPIPIRNPRPEFFTADDNTIESLGADPLGLLGLPAHGASVGTLVVGGGLDAAFAGAPTKASGESAAIGVSTIGSGNWAGKKWGAIPGSSAISLQYVINAVTAQAPNDMAFLKGGASTALSFDGSSDGVTWTTLASKNTAGSVGELVSFAAADMANLDPYSYHRVNVSGDGTNPVAIARITFAAAGPAFGSDPEGSDG